MGEWRRVLDSLQIEVPTDCGREADLFEALAGGEWEDAETILRGGDVEWRWPNAVETAVRQLTPLRGRIHAAPPPENAEKWVGSRGSWSNISRLLLQVSYGLKADDAPEATFGTRGASMELGGRGNDEVSEYVVCGVRESLLGDTLEAQRVERRLQAMRDSATSRTFDGAYHPWFVLMEVGPAYRRGDWSVVIDCLEAMVARIHDPGVGNLAGDAYLALWLLAEAYVQAGRLEDAIPHLESILQRPTGRVQDWELQGYIQPAARFKLAGLYARTGDLEGAREEYQAFLDTFTNPDPDFEWMVEEAGAGLASTGG